MPRLGSLSSRSLHGHGISVPAAAASSSAVQAIVSSRNKSMFGDTTEITTLSSPDLYIMGKRSGGDQGVYFFNRATNAVQTPSNTNAEFYKGTNNWVFGTNNITFYGGWDSGPIGYVDIYLKKTAGVFDTLNWIGANGTTVLTHNLGKVPEFVIVKATSSATEGALTAHWYVYWKGSNGTQYRFYLDSANQSYYQDTFPGSSSTTFTPYYVGYQAGNGGNGWSCDTSGISYVAYAFATKAGVSFVGSYVGNGTARTIDCGFTSGANFILIKAHADGNNWLLFDSARGITTGNDPYLRINQGTGSGAEVTSANLVGPANAGFAVTSDPLVNTNGVVYMVLALV